jgi:hypothetical protein
MARGLDPILIGARAARRGQPALVARQDDDTSPPVQQSHRRRAWARQDSNLRPTGYEPAALTPELRAPAMILSHCPRRARRLPRTRRPLRASHEHDPPEPSHGQHVCAGSYPMHRWRAQVVRAIRMQHEAHARVFTHSALVGLATSPNVLMRAEWYSRTASARAGKRPSWALHSWRRPCTFCTTQPMEVVQWQRRGRNPRPRKRRKRRPPSGRL